MIHLVESEVETIRKVQTIVILKGEKYMYIKSDTHSNTLHSDKQFYVQQQWQTSWHSSFRINKSAQFNEKFQRKQKFNGLCQAILNQGFGAGACLSWVHSHTFDIDQQELLLCHVWTALMCRNQSRFLKNIITSGNTRH